RVLAHLPPHQRVGFRLSFGPERAQQTAVDESLVRLVGRDLSLDVPIFRRRALVDPRVMLLDGRELGRGERRQELQDDLAILLGHLLDGLDLAHPEEDAPLDPARDRHDRDLLRWPWMTPRAPQTPNGPGAARVYMGGAAGPARQPRSRASTSSGIGRACNG